jgi:hypothetical protein
MVDVRIAPELGLLATDGAWHRAPAAARFCRPPSSVAVKRSIPATPERCRVPVRQMPASAAQNVCALIEEDRTDCDLPGRSIEQLLNGCARDIVFGRIHSRAGTSLAHATAAAPQTLGHVGSEVEIDARAVATGTAAITGKRSSIAIGAAALLLVHASDCITRVASERALVRYAEWP